MVLSMPHATPLNAQSDLHKQNSSCAWVFVHEVLHLSNKLCASMLVSCDCLCTPKGKTMSNACVKRVAKAELEPLMASSGKVDEILPTVCKSKKKFLWPMVRLYDSYINSNLFSIFNKKHCVYIVLYKV